MHRLFQSWRKRIGTALCVITFGLMLVVLLHPMSWAQVPTEREAETANLSVSVYHNEAVDVSLRYGSINYMLPEEAALESELGMPEEALIAAPKDDLDCSGVQSLVAICDDSVCDRALHEQFIH